MSREKAIRRLKSLGLPVMLLRRERRSKTLRQLAAKAGVSHEWVRQLARAAGVTEKWISPVQRLLTSERILRGLAERRIDALAEQLGCSVTAIERAIRRLGIHQAVKMAYKERIAKRAVERFWSCVHWNGPVRMRGLGRCWSWKGPRFYDGRARFGPYPAVRFSYELNVGEIPPRKHLTQICRNLGCVNPKHLRVIKGARRR